MTEPIGIQARVWTLRIPAPVTWINANERMSPLAKSMLVREWRGTARVLALAAKLPRQIPHVHILATLHFRDDRRRDAANFQPTLKAIVDGLVDHGLVADDSTGHVDGPDARIGAKLPPREYGPVGEIVLTITEVLDV